MKRKYFGTDGIRGRVGSDLITPEFALKLGWAAGRVLGREGGAVLIGKDTRISGYMFESALEAGLTAAGVDTLLTGPMPTPGIAYLTRTFRARAGIVISASHNPYYDNGFKFFSADGNKLPDEVELDIETEIDKPLQSVSSEKLGKAMRINDASGRYIEFCKSTLPQGLTLQGLKIVVDCSNGAAYHITPDVLRELGAEVIAIGNQPNGLNINAGVGSTEPQALQAEVVAQQADAGIALDGDADRLIMVNHQGVLVDGDEILYIIAISRQQQGRLHGPVVGTLMTNLGLELALRAKGIGLQRTNVGDRYIVQQLLANDWCLGGEPSGHIICRDVSTTGDGTVAALQVLAEMQLRGKRLEELTQAVEKCPQLLVNLDLGNLRADVLMQLDSVLSSVADAEKELAQNGRVLLRPSGTEPLLRVMVEGTDATQVEQLANSIADDIRNAMSQLQAAS